MLFSLPVNIVKIVIIPLRLSGTFMANTPIHPENGMYIEANRLPVQLDGIERDNAYVPPFLIFSSTPETLDHDDGKRLAIPAKTCQ
jgi:hypothetical protein